MSDPAVISGDFCTFRHVQGRKVLQIVIEVPAEAAGAVFAKLGMPGSGEGIPVAVARLQTAPEPIAKPEAPKERRPFIELPYSQQAALRCGEPGYRDFLQQTDPMGWAHYRDNALFQGDEVASYVRGKCDVQSRSDIVKGTQAGGRWERLEAEYYAWQRGMR